MESAKSQSAQFETKVLPELLKLGSELELILAEIAAFEKTAYNRESPPLEADNSWRSLDAKRQRMKVLQEELRTALQPQCNEYRTDFLTKFPHFSEQRLQIKPMDSTNGKVGIVIYFDKPMDSDHSLTDDEFDYIRKSCPVGFEARYGEVVVPNLSGQYPGPNIPKMCIRYTLSRSKETDITSATKDLAGQAIKI